MYIHFQSLCENSVLIATVDYRVFGDGRGSNVLIYYHRLPILVCIDCIYTNGNPVIDDKLSEFYTHFMQLKNAILDNNIEEAEKINKSLQKFRDLLDAKIEYAKKQEPTKLHPFFIGYMVKHTDEGRIFIIDNIEFPAIQSPLESGELARYIWGTFIYHICNPIKLFCLKITYRRLTSSIIDGIRLNA